VVHFVRTAKDADQDKQMLAAQSEVSRCRSDPFLLEGHIMVTYRRVVPLRALTGKAADSAGFALHMSYRLRANARRRQEAKLVDWEEEGGSVAVPAIVPPLL
jgi:hypothetical protein